MSTRRGKLSLLGTSALAAAAAVMGVPATVSATDFTDSAQVIASTPIYERVNHPKKECWNQTVSYQESHRSGGSPLGAIIGGIAGGVIGHQIGSGTGNAIATGAGAVGAAVAGDKAAPNGGGVNVRAQPSPPPRPPL